MNKEQNATIQQINAHIAKVEAIATELLTGVDINELSPLERMAMACRFLGLYQRAIALKNVCELGQPDQQSDILIASLMRGMRGEDVPQEALDLIDKVAESTLMVEEEEDGSWA